MQGTNIDASAGPKTFWDFLRAGKFSAEKRQSKHRRYTHSRKPKRAKKKARLVAQASQRRNRSQKPKKKLGVKPRRVKV